MESAGLGWKSEPKRPLIVSIIVTTVDAEARFGTLSLPLAIALVLSATLLLQRHRPCHSMHPGHRS